MTKCGDKKKPIKCGYNGIWTVNQLIKPKTRRPIKRWRHRLLNEQKFQFFFHLNRYAKNKNIRPAKPKEREREMNKPKESGRSLRPSPVGGVCDVTQRTKHPKPDKSTFSLFVSTFNIQFNWFTISLNHN